jgi:uncharacterized protein with von Willebrand factor type A (vWA) domain
MNQADLDELIKKVHAGQVTDQDKIKFMAERNSTLIEFNSLLKELIESLIKDAAGR